MRKLRMNLHSVLKCLSIFRAINRFEQSRKDESFYHKGIETSIERIRKAREVP
jgi:hypothetical protein